MAWLDDVTTVMHAGGAGTAAVDIFHTLKAQIPTGDGPYSLLVETGGSSPEGTQNAAGIAYEWPGCQLTVCATNPTVARARLILARNLLVVVKNQTINGTWYRRIRALQSNPIDLPLDAKGRARYALNFIGEKRP